ncbi:MAG: GNAT family N-acetyltransferase [Eggerthellaceae bacterium]|nr:GNAT family N-acetyltransferase [Eggerthellaceae bacterium]
MALSFIPVKTPEDQEKLADMTGEIWRGYWPAIIGEAQTEYMVEQFQSLQAIERDMAEADYEYWMLVATEGADRKRTIVGFTGGHNEPETNRFFISKIYLYPEARGHGYARRVVEFYEDLCFTRGFDAMYLTVNKYNELGIRAYKGTGFDIIDSVETDIGEGFIMDDYIMEHRMQ